MTSLNQLNLDTAESHVDRGIRMASRGTSDERRHRCSGRVVRCDSGIDLRAAVMFWSSSSREWLVEAVAAAPVVVGNAIPFAC